MHFKMPTKYYEMLYIEKINDDIINRCKEINVNPYFNKFIKTTQLIDSLSQLTEFNIILKF
mgnify:CR=1 FL=1